MKQNRNEIGQPIGEFLPHWQGAALPARTAMAGRLARVEALDVDRHGHELFEAFSADTDGSIWTYMSFGPFATKERFRAWMKAAVKSEDPLFYALLELESGKAVGVASFLRIEPKSGVIEVGNITFAPCLQRTAIATEVMFLFMQRVFRELGYRRYEWKCDALNAPSRRAAERFGFTYDGLFEQALIYKGRNRDTAWYSILDKEWPALERAYVRWLSPDNFDDAGRQRHKLADLIAGQRRPAPASDMNHAKGKSPKLTK